MFFSSRWRAAGDRIVMHSESHIQYLICPHTTCTRTMDTTNTATLAEYFDTYVDECRSYCESCDTVKTNVRWWMFTGGLSIATNPRPNG